MMFLLLLVSSALCFIIPPRGPIYNPHGPCIPEYNCYPERYQACTMLYCTYPHNCNNCWYTFPQIFPIEQVDNGRFMNWMEQQPLLI